MGISTDSIEWFAEPNINKSTCIEERQQALDLISDCHEGLDYFGLEVSEDGSGGVYFIKSQDNTRIAVFKPEDEEAYAPNNPKGHVGNLGQTGLRKGIRSGEAACREVAAYFMDRNGFSGVPFTFLAEISDRHLNYLPPAVYERGQYPKRGSLQEYIYSQEHIENLSPCLFTSEQIHRIGILDIVICNTDRNTENILVQRTGTGDYNLVPIDHGYCLPDILEIAWCDWIWMDWPQAKLAFSDECVQHVQSLDIESSSVFLRDNLGIRDECIMNMKIMTKLLKVCVSAGMNLHQIAMIICRDNLEIPSLLEVVIARARNIAAESPRRKTTLAKEHLLSPPSTKKKRLRRNSSANTIPHDRFYGNFFMHYDILLEELIQKKSSQWKVTRKLSVHTPRSSPRLSMSLKSDTTLQGLWGTQISPLGNFTSTTFQRRTSI